VEPLADAVTEETLARVIFEKPPHPLPPLGELVEVTVALPALDPVPTIPGASLHRVAGETGVWVVSGNELEFRRVRLGQRDLEGRIQVLEGLEPGETVVEYSLHPLNTHSKFTVVETLSTGRRL
jgi:multidrug efflux pump subunit AcrA (membrane-fusion protein)